MKPSAITLHCADSRNGDNSVDASIIRQWHLARGWKDIGYHFVIKVDGTIEVGRSVTTIGAHVLGANVYHGGINLGICLVGEDRFTEAQFISLRSLLTQLQFQYPEIKTADLFGHYQFPSGKAQGKTCPNMDMQKVLDWFLHHNEQAISGYLLGAQE